MLQTANMPERNEVINVTAGPSQLPLSVLEEAAKGLINFNNTGIGITEISHRSSEFIRLNEELESSVRGTLGVPDTHVILFTQGGATTQFAAIPLNLLAWKFLLKTKKAPSEWTMDYIVTGSWSDKAAEEAERLGYGAKLNNAADSRHHSAGVQKNLGPAGLTIVIIRKDLLTDPVEAQTEGAPPIPTMLSYGVASKAKSLYNTPPMFSMYTTLLVVKHLKAGGGLEKLREINKQKQAKLYSVLQQAEKAGKVRIRVQEASRSWMNVTFDNFKSDEDAKFVEAANKQRIVGVKGHRSVGGIRISLYNAVTLEQVDKIVAFIKQYYAL
ncbi:hypothetical protein RSAG8_00695, partial [Rhizoctonia solani AG-8 WAC10335]